MKQKLTITKIIDRIYDFISDDNTELEDLLDVYNYIFGTLTEDDVDNTIRK